MIDQGFAPTAARGAEDSGDRTVGGETAGTYVLRYLEQQRAEARRELAAKQIDAMLASFSNQEDPLLRALQTADPQDRQAVALLLAEQASRLDQDVQQVLKQLDRQIEELGAAWEETRTAIARSEALAKEIRSDPASGHPGHWFVAGKECWFWLALLVAIGTFLGAALHAQRHALRRWAGPRRAMILARVGLAGALTLLVLVAAGLGLADRLSEMARSGRSGGVPASDAGAYGSEAPSDPIPTPPSAEDLQKKRSELQQKLRQRLADLLPPSSSLPALAEGFRDHTLEVAERVMVRGALAKALRGDLERLAQRRAEADAAAEAAAQHARQRRNLHTGLGLSTLAGVIAGGWLLRARARRRRTAMANTCPLCLGTIRQSALSANGAAATGSRVVRCENVLDKVRGVRCHYTIRDAYRAMPKLCFPTLGVPRAGKTHWLAMLYWQLNRGNYPRSVRFERVRSIDPATGEDFDRIVEQILLSRLGTTATQLERIPHPLVFNFRDGDRWGPSSVLVNIFDYSGEVTTTLSLDDYRRRRAMEADGYFFFLDPTLPAEPQAKALADFREDLRLVKGVEAKRALHVPLALCVSKIDLLAGQAYASPSGGDAVAQFYEDLAEIDPTGEAMRLEVMEARSARVARLRDTIWPGWQIERTIEELFRGYYLFFPLTPVGLDGRGERDLNLRTIAPFGLLEPLVWLLHMNGYPVLE